MNSVIDFASDAKVHETVLITMVISSFLAAIRRFKVVTKWWQLLWNFFYDWATGFWSMKTGQPLHPVPGTVQQLETHDDGNKRDVLLTTSIPSDPTLPVDPAKTK